MYVLVSPLPVILGGERLLDCSVVTWIDRQRIALLPEECACTTYTRTPCVVVTGASLTL